MTIVPQEPDPRPAPKTSPRRDRGRRLARRLVATAVLLAALGAGLYHGRKFYLKSRSARVLATAPVRQGEFLVMIRCRGELLSRRSVQIIAPQKVPNLRIVWMAPQNATVKEGDVVIRFDPSAARQQLVEKQASLEQAQAGLDQASAENRILAEQDRLDLKQAEYDVERARLEASKSEIISPIEGAEARVDLRVAENKLLVLKATAALHEASGKQKAASLERVRDQAKLECDLTRERLARMELKTPLSGVVVFQSNYSQGWMNAKPFTVGDSVWSGATLAEIPDLATLEMDAKVEEVDRARMNVGNEARIRVDAMPEKAFFARLTSLSPLTEPSFDWTSGPAFHGYAQLQTSDPRLRPGMNGTLDVILERIPAAISIPARALFTRRGRPVVYVVEKPGRTRVVEVKVRARNTDEIAVEGVPANATVSLVDLEKSEAKS
ncbi:MAG: efflux RND transporter periplasmic adaptor subunit [Bryobacterales bacterium]|nr:efflux RND transporter periplasmic adaptor subunit [Bryobacterales bacterium]